MEAQWPMILFTALLAWSAGLFATQGIYALRGQAPKAQMPALIVSLVLLVAGGIAVFMHLQHWERIFNGFGHMTSGITQELIAIVIMVVIMVIYFAMLRRSPEKPSVPAWVAVLAILSALALCVVMSMSYLMASRPAWNSPLWVCVIIGNACVLGPATMAFLADLKGEAADGMLALVGSIVNAITTLAYVAFLGTVVTDMVEAEFYYDLTHPMEDIVPVGNVLFNDSAVMVWLGAVVVGAILPIIFAFLGKKSGNWKTWGILAAICACIGAICIRLAFYASGASVFGIY